MKQNRGVEMVSADGSSFEALFDKYRAIQRTNVIDSGKKFGVGDPEKIMDTYQANIKKWENLTKDINRDIDKFAALVWEHVYSKVDVDSF